MEKWEEEYNAIVRAKGVVETHNGDACPVDGKPVGVYWLEAVRPDGTKLLVPRMDLIRKEDKRFGRRFLRALEVVSRLILVVCAVVLLVLVCCLFGVFQEKSFDTHTEPTASSFDSFVQGKGLKHMATELAGIRTRQAETLNQYVSNGCSFTNDEMDLWVDAIDDDFVIIEHLAFDESYAAFVEAHRNLLLALEEYILAAEAGDSDAADAAHERLSGLLAGMHSLFAAALDENGVEYVRNEDGSLRVFYLDC